MSNVLIICGLNGAGKSTLAKALAKKMDYHFIDIEDVYFQKKKFRIYVFRSPFF